MKTKTQFFDDCVWGFYGSKYAEEELKRMLAEA